MRFITFQSPTRVGAGLVEGKHVLDLGLAYWRCFKRPFKFVDVGDFLAQGAYERLADLDRRKCYSDPKVVLPREGLILKAPVMRPLHRGGGAHMVCSLARRHRFEASKRVTSETPMRSSSSN